MKLFRLTILLALVMTVLGISAFADSLGWNKTYMQCTTLNGIAYGNNLYVAVGTDGTIKTSPDAATWLYKTTGTTCTLNSVTYGENFFVTVGDYGMLLTSPNGTNWTQRNSNTQQHLRSITYQNNLYVAVGTGGTIITSPDCTTWTVQTSGTTVNLNSIAYGNGKFAAVGETGVILTSADGISWTIAQQDALYIISGITYGSNGFLAIGYYRFEQQLLLKTFTSTDGINWTEQSIEFNSIPLAVIYHDGIFVIISNSGMIATSQDGTTWSTQYTASPNITLNGIAYGVQGYVAVGEKESVVKSPDGVSWSQVSKDSYSFNGVAYGSGLFAAVDDSGVIMTSADGKQWTERLTSFTQGLSRRLNAIIYENGKFVAVGGQFNSGTVMGRILTSANGIDWTSCDTHVLSEIIDITYGNGLYVALTSRGYILTSTDGTVWTESTANVSTDVRKITYGNSKFVILGSNGNLYTSPDAVTWTSGSYGSSFNMNDICFNGALFVAVGDNGTILTSQDAITWTTRIAGMGRTYDTVAYCYGRVIASSGNSESLKALMSESNNGLTWAFYESVTGNRIYGFAYGNGTYVAVGQNRCILYAANPPFKITYYPGTWIEPSISVKNESESPKQGIWVIVLYDPSTRRLHDVRTYNISLQPGQSNNVQALGFGDFTVKSFVWDNANTMHPLSNNLQLDYPPPPLINEN